MREVALIEVYQSEGLDLTNATIGGEGSVGCVRDESFRENLRQKVTGRKHSAESLARMSAAQSGPNNPNYGKTTPPEVRAKQSAAQSGEKHSQYGKSRSEETKRKLSEANKGRKMSEEAKENVRRGLHKRYHTSKSVIKHDCTFCIA